MIIAAAPGGVTSNILTKFANGDVALSISLTAVISLISIITVPLIIFTSADLFEITNISQNISMTGIALKMFLVVTVPVILGMIIRKFAENFVNSKIQIFEKLNILLFVIFFIAAFYEERESFIDFLMQAGFITFILNIIMMIVAYYLGKIFCIRNKTTKMYCFRMWITKWYFSNICFYTNIRTDIVYITPTAAYALIMYITGFIFVFILKNKV